MRFELTDGKKTVAVVHQGDPPELFKDERAGRVRGPLGGGAVGAPFDTDRILIKHGSEYKPPKVDTEKRRRGRQRERGREGDARRSSGIALGVGASAVGIVFLLAAASLRQQRRS